MGFVNKKYLDKDTLSKMDRYFRAANYLSVGQLYLMDNPLLRRKLTMGDVKPCLVGHWGTAPGQNFIYVHLNRVINKYKLNMMYISGPGHGGQSLVSNSYLEGTYSEVYPDIEENIKGMRKLFKQFSFPGGIPSHVAPETPGSIHEGGELGYSLAHAFGTVLDNPNLICSCVIGDGEAETGPLMASYQIIRLLNPWKDGAVLPILHLNGYKIANPTILARIPEEQLENFYRGLGYEPYYVEGENTEELHNIMASALDRVIEKIKKIQFDARNFNRYENVSWPIIILKTPKGWTGPKELNHLPIEGSFRSHQVPVPVDKKHPENLSVLESWLKSYKPDELFDKNGSLKKELKDIAPKGIARMSANPITNGGLLSNRILISPGVYKFEIPVLEHGVNVAEDMKELGKYVGELIKLNPNSFRSFSPDEAWSNRLYGMFNYSDRVWNLRKERYDENLSYDGRIVDSILSEHVCEGLLEGYILTGRHGFFNSYEAFVRIVDSMVSQHAKWLKMCKDIPWRESIPSLNLVLTSHCWQQDHNGFTHQDPGFINHIVTKKSDIVRVYLPYDANSLISCFDHCIQTKNYVNVITASKQPHYQWLNMKDTIKHCAAGIGEWKWASTSDKKPELIMACCGDTPTIECLAAVTILREEFPKLKIKVINIVDLMRLQSDSIHPHGLSDEAWLELFPDNVPIIMAYHGYPSLVHELTYRRVNDDFIHVHGYIEEGTITTAFDMRVTNKLDRYHLVIDALNYLNINGKDKVIKKYKDKLVKHFDYIREYGEDMPEITSWKWTDSKKI